MINLQKDAKFIYVTWVFNVFKSTKKKYLQRRRFLGVILYKN